MVKENFFAGVNRPEKLSAILGSADTCSSLLQTRTGRPEAATAAMPVIPALLSGAEVSAIFGRSSRTIARWEQRGYLVPIRVGRVKFYRADDIGRLVSDQLENAMRTRADPATPRMASHPEPPSTPK